MKTKILILTIGMLLATSGTAWSAVRYVDVNSTTPTPPYLSWATAAAGIQQAVDAATAGDEIVVTNGTYFTGGKALSGTMTNRVAVDKPLTLRSVNGPQFTIIQGFQVPGATNADGAIRCVYLANGASLSGFTLSNGATRGVYDDPTKRESRGGGVWCESATAVVSNCVMSGNAASYGGGGAYGGTLNNCTLIGNSAQGQGCIGCETFGGGAYGGTFNNCTLSGNSASGGGGAAGGDFIICTLNNCTLAGNSSFYGGGAYICALNNCTLSGNTASYGGGGAYQGTLNNCIVYFNTAVQGVNYSYSTLNYSCTTPLPPDGIGNISADPQLASASHLSAASPCRGVGNPAYTSGTDIDGEAWASRLVRLPSAAMNTTLGRFRDR